MAQYRKKPVVIEAIQFTDETKDQVFNWISCSHYACWDVDGNPKIVIGTLEGKMDALLGDWVIKGIKGEFYPCKDEIFRATYEPVEG